MGGAGGSTGRTADQPETAIPRLKARGWTWVARGPTHDPFAGARRIQRALDPAPTLLCLSLECFGSADPGQVIAEALACLSGPALIAFDESAQLPGRTRQLLQARGHHEVLLLRGPRGALAAEPVDQALLVRLDPTLAGARAALGGLSAAGCSALVVGPPGAGQKGLVQSISPPASVDPPWPGARAEMGGWSHPDLTEIPEGRLRSLLRGARPRPALDPFVALADDPPRLVPFGLCPELAGLLGHDPAILRCLTRAQRHLPWTPLWICGEPGTGRRALAQAVHRASGRSGELLELDLGALHEHEALEKLAYAPLFLGVGTLLLEGLAWTSPATQAALLRRWTQAGPVAPRLMTLVDADLERARARGDLHPDLARLLYGVHLSLPPLREREDRYRLARRIRDLLHQGPQPAKRIEKGALDRHSWPHNLLELTDRLGHALCYGAHPTRIRASDLQPLPPIAVRLAVSGPMGWDPAPLAARLGLQVIELAPFESRGPAAARAAILALLDGRPPTRAGLERLSSVAWRGGADGLVRVVRDLPSAPLSPEITSEALSGLAGPTPMRLGVDGSPPREVPANGVLVGGTLAEGLQVSRRRALQARERLSNATRILGQTPILLPVEGIPFGSILLHRTAAGLSARLFGGQAEARSEHRPESMQLSAGFFTNLGQAGEISWAPLPRP